MGRHLRPIRSCDIGQWIARFESVRFHIGYPVVRTVGRTDVQSGDYENCPDE